MAEQAHQPSRREAASGKAKFVGNRFWGRIHFTLEGKGWLVASAMLWGLGMFKGFNLITLLATFMMVLLALNVLLAGRRLGSLRLRRHFAPPVFAGIPFPLTVEAENTGTKPLTGVRIEDTGRDHRAVRFVMNLAAGDTVRFTLHITLPRRGWYTGDKLQAACAYPLGFAERRVAVKESASLLVFPRLGRLHRGKLRQFLSQAPTVQDRVHRRHVRHLAAQSEFHGLRSFRSGDSPRMIHWRTSARRGELMVREFEDLATDDLILVLDPWLPPVEPGQVMPPTSPLLEEAVSLAATVCWEWCRQKGDRLSLVVAGDAPTLVNGVTGPGHALVLMERLAVVQGGRGPYIDRLPEKLANAELPVAPILVVSTRPNDLDDRLTRRLDRPAAGIDLSANGSLDFYERADGREP